MRFFLDTANIAEIKEIAELGIIDGVTTNPSILSKEGKNWEDGIQGILKIVNGPVFVEVFSSDSEGMVKEALELAKWDSRLVIKLPMVLEGLKAMRILSQKGVTIAATLVYTVAQAVIAAQVGAMYVAPFVARSFEVNQDGIQLIEEIATIFKLQNCKCKILAASIRTPQDAIRSLNAGADILTLPYAVIKQMIFHPLTDLTLKKFMNDWEAVNS